MKTQEMLRKIFEDRSKVFSDHKGYYASFHYGVLIHSAHYDHNNHSFEVLELGITEYLLDEYEWEEVKTPYTFEEAYKLCKEEGKKG